MEVSSYNRRLTTGRFTRSCEEPSYTQPRFTNGIGGGRALEPYLTNLGSKPLRRPSPPVHAGLQRAFGLLVGGFCLPNRRFAALLQRLLFPRGSETWRQVL